MKSYTNHSVSILQCIVIPLACMIIILVFQPGCSSNKAYSNVKLNNSIVDIPESWTTSHHEATDAPVSYRLMDIVTDDTLSDLIVKTLESNPDIRATAHRLKASGYRLTETAAARWPAISLEAQKRRGNENIDISGKQVTRDSHRALLGVSWEIDIWGRLTDEHKAALSCYASEQDMYRAARDALCARVICTWIDYVTSSERIDCEQNRYAETAFLEIMTAHRYEKGLGSYNDLLGARTDKSVTAASVAAERQHMEQTLCDLFVLLGKPFKTEAPQADSLPSISLPQTDIPASVLENRPDIRAALHRLESADSQSKAAAKTLLPGITLSAYTSRSDPVFKKLTSGDTIWDVMGTLTQPVFQRGRLLAGKRAARAETEAAFEDYRAHVIKAINEVETALRQEKELAEQENSVAHAYRTMEQNRISHELRYCNGLSTRYELAAVRLQSTELERELVSIRALRLKNRIYLALALGMGIGENR